MPVPPLNLMGPACVDEKAACVAESKHLHLRYSFKCLPPSLNLTTMLFSINDFNILVSVTERTAGLNCPQQFQGN